MKNKKRQKFKCFKHVPLFLEIQVDFAHRGRGLFTFTTKKTCESAGLAS